MAEWVGYGGLLLTNIGVFIGMFKHFNNRISRVYERFDEYKRDTDNKYVPNAMCKVMHDNNASNLNGLEERIEKRFDKLDEQIIKLLDK